MNFPGFPYTCGIILVEILTVDDVITYLWRNYSCIDDAIWLNSSWYGSTYPYDPANFYLKWDIFELL